MMKAIKVNILPALTFALCVGLNSSATAQEGPTQKIGEAMTQLRIARPTDNLPEVVRFYREGLGLEVVASFENHQGFDGVMLGNKGLPYHLEFTHHRGHKVGKAPTQDNLLVFYLPSEAEWKTAVERMQRHGYEPVKSYNPYWDVKGRTFEDVDGYRVVLQNASWDL